MQVWVVIEEIPYEPGYLRGIWSTKFAAEMQRDSLTQGDTYLHYYVEEVTVDTVCNLEV